MSYLDTVVGPHETVLRRAKMHWVAYVPGALIAGFGVFIYQHVDLLGLILIAAGFVHLARAIFKGWCTELAVTNKKVIVKTGFLMRKTIEQRLGKIDSVRVDQTLLGRVLCYGSIEVTGSGMSLSPVPNIADPIGFRKAIESAEAQSNV